VDRSYWHRQAFDTPLFPDLLWSRPENKIHAGKLLIMGGNAFGFVEPAEAFKAAETAGAGTVRMLLPDSLRKFVGPTFTAGELAPSTPSGSFAQTALAELLAMSEWAEGVLLAGGFGRNSETAVLLEKFPIKYSGQLTITQDAADYFTANPLGILNRQNTALVVSFAQLQKIASQAHFPTAFTFEMDFLRLVTNLHEFTNSYPVNVITKHLDTLFVAAGGQVSTTKLAEDMKVWRVITAAKTSVWWMQNPSKPFEALTTALVEPKP
jgi:hypothetical protein